MFSLIARFIVNNTWAQWAIGVLAAITFYKVWGEKREHDGRMQERERQTKSERIALEKQEREANEMVRKASGVRNEHGSYPDADSVPEPARSILFGD
jgi:hypothetical protein